MKNIWSIALSTSTATPNQTRPQAWSSARRPPASLAGRIVADVMLASSVRIAETAAGTCGRLRLSLFAAGQLGGEVTAPRGQFVSQRP